MLAFASVALVVSAIAALCAMELSIKAGFKGDTKKRARIRFGARFTIAAGASAFAYLVLQGPVWLKYGAVCAVLGWALVVVYMLFPHKQYLAQFYFAPKQPNR